MINKIEELIKENRGMIESEWFKEQHRKRKEAFSRVRKLSFPVLIVFIMQKSVKSLQLRLNEWFEWFGGETVSNSAFTQARANLKHTAFIALNDRNMEIYYGDGIYERYQGLRVLAIDGSKVRVPKGAEIKEQFGAISYSNQKEEVQGEHNYSQVSVLYDVLNRIAITAECGVARAYEVDLAKKHLEYTKKEEDLLLCDRNYATYDFMTTLIERNLNFVIRCPAKYVIVKEMQRGSGAESRLMKVKNSQNQPLNLRFVRVLLSTGEYEILVTSLLDEQLYPTEMFKELYHLRWGIETFYGLLKTRLELENFTGKTVESVLQDIYSTLYLTNIESILTAEATANLKDKTTSKNQQKVNHSVSFHALKTEALNLLLSNMPISNVLNKLQKLFLTNPTLDKKKPTTPRNTKTARHLLHYHRTQRKHVF